MGGAFYFCQCYKAKTKELNKVDHYELLTMNGK